MSRPVESQEGHLSIQITDILKYLETRDDTLRSMMASFAGCTTRARADELVKVVKIREAEYAPDFRAASKKPFCSIFHAVIDLARSRQASALQHLEDAERGFGCSGQEWNLAMARWMHALIDLNLEQAERARMDFESAGTILRRLSSDYRRKGRYEESEECLRLVERIRESAVAQAPAQKTNPGPGRPAPLPKTAPRRSGSLVFPVYDPVSAGKGGHFIFEDEPQGQVTITELSIDEKPYHLYSLREGEPVTLRPRVYRWMYVVGDSMNQAHPHPLVQGDCILVVETGSAGLTPHKDDIVVAALVDPAHPDERAGVVKRYTGTGLSSESTKEYPLIPLKKAKVKGIVLAVAKPVTQ